MAAATVAVAKVLTSVAARMTSMPTLTATVMVAVMTTATAAVAVATTTTTAVAAAAATTKVVSTDINQLKAAAEETAVMEMATGTATAINSKQQRKKR